mgnify:FL=1
MEAFYKYIKTNYKTPDEAKKQSVSGKIILSFIVEKDGKLSDIKILRDLGFGTGEEAVRVLSKSPNWKPGKLNDTVVRTLLIQTFSI